MKANFAVSLKAVLVHEGGYVNHPKDPGGATNKGITQAVYDAYRARHKQTLQSVKSISYDEVATIYKLQYWDAVKGDDLPSGVDYCVFDFAVNSGVSRATKFLQTALGVKPDGIIGQITIAAAEDADASKLINRMCDARMEFLEGLRTWRTFGEGWTARVKGVRSMAAKMAAFPPASPVEPQTPAPAPSQHETTQTPPVKPAAPSSAIGKLVGGLIALAIAALAAWLGIGGSQ